MRKGYPYYGLRVLGWLSVGMTYDEIIADFPELTKEDILACLAFAARRERSLQTTLQDGGLGIEESPILRLHNDMQICQHPYI